MEKHVEKLTKFLATTAGRERLNRFIQYFCRFLTGYGESKAWSTESLKRIQVLMLQATNTQKLMRFGKQLEFFQNARKALFNVDEVLGYTLFVKNTSMGIWLVHDLLSWIHSTGLLQIKSIKDIIKRGNQWWMVALMASLLNSLHRLRWNSLKLQLEEKALKAAKVKDNKVEQGSSIKRLESLKSERFNLLFTTVQDSLDLMIPVSALEYVSIDNSIVGLAGTLTSLMGGYTVWKST